MVYILQTLSSRNSSLPRFFSPMQKPG